MFDYDNDVGLQVKDVVVSGSCAIARKSTDINIVPPLRIDQEIDKYIASVLFRKGQYYLYHGQSNMDYQH